MAAGVLASVLSGGLSMLGDYVSSRQKYWENIDLAKRANKMDVQNWKMQTEYNTPVNQMKRLAEAGLNPNLMYGTGSGANQADQIAKYQSMEPANTQYGNGPANVFNALNAYTDLKAKQAQINQTKEITRGIRVDSDLKVFGKAYEQSNLYNRMMGLQHDTTIKSVNRNVQEWLYKRGVQKKQGINTLRQSQATADKVESDAFIRRMEADLYRQIDKLGAGGTGSSIMKNLLKILVSRLGG